MEQIPVPKKGDDPCVLWRSVAPAVQVVNSLLKIQVNLDGQQNKFTVSDGNMVLELKLGGVSVQKIDFCEGGTAGFRYVLCSDFIPNPAPAVS